MVCDKIRMVIFIKNDENTQNMMGFECSWLKKLDELKPHPGRVTMKDAFMEGTVRPMILGLADILAVGRHSHYSPFLNPQLHERRPSPQRFYRQNKSFQAAYHRSAFARYMPSQLDVHDGIVTRRPFSALKKSVVCETSV